MPSTTRASGIGVLLMIGACFLCMLVGDGLAGRPGAWIAGFVFFGYVAAANWWYARDLFTGRALARRGRFDAAIDRLGRALARFEALPIVDALRQVLLFAPTASRYRESALLALAHAHALAGSAEAPLWFERAARAYPKSGQAASSLALLRVGAKIGARGGSVTDPRQGARP